MAERIDICEPLNLVKGESADNASENYEPLNLVKGESAVSADENYEAYMAPGGRDTPLSDEEEGGMSGDDLASTSDDDEPDYTALRQSISQATMEGSSDEDGSVRLLVDSDEDEDYASTLRMSGESLGRTDFPQDGLSDDGDELVADDGTCWSHTPPQQLGLNSAENVYRVPASQLVGCNDVRGTLHAFQLFFTASLVDVIVHYTNLEGRRKKGESFMETDDVEMRAFVGCLLFLGAMKQSMTATTILFDSFYGQGMLRATFSRTRFLQLLAFIRFDDKETRKARRRNDVFAPFRDFWEEFMKNLSRHYIPGPFITIGEQLVPFRGRCSFLQHLPSKPDKYGLKIFWAADAENSFPLVAQPDLGKPLGAQPKVNLGRNMAIQLSRPYFRSGRNITADNFFADKELSDTLLANDLTLVGTVRSNKLFLPDPFKQKKGLKLHSSSFVFQGKTTLVNYQINRNKNLVVMSTLHHDKGIEPQAYKKKPDIVRFYNSTKGAVKVLDKMTQAFSTKRLTKRWPMVMFFNTIDLSTIAARVIWTTKFPGSPLAHFDARQQFMFSIAEKLCTEHVQRRLALKNISRPLRDTIMSMLNHLQQKATGRSEGSSRQSPKRPAPSISRSEVTLRKAAKQGGPNKGRGRCTRCPWKLDRKTRQSCLFCAAWLCHEHTVILCQDCTLTAIMDKRSSCRVGLR